MSTPTKIIDKLVLIRRKSKRKTNLKHRKKFRLNYSKKYREKHSRSKNKQMENRTYKDHDS
jgi:hypothetical protein